MGDVSARDRIRKPAHELPLCEGVAVHYTFSAIKVKNHKRSNSANLLKLSLYSAYRKKKIGKEVRLQYAMPKKKVRRTPGLTAGHPPSAEKILAGVQKLFRENLLFDLDTYAKDEQVQSALSTKLIVFWLKNHEAYCQKYASTPAERQEIETMMTQVLLCMGDWNLADLYEKPLLCVCQRALSEVRAIVDRKAYQLASKSLQQGGALPSTSFVDTTDVTQRVHEYAQLLRNLFREFLLQQGTSEQDMETILRGFSKHFTARPHLGALMGRGLRPKSLGLAEYRALWQQLCPLGHKSPLDSMNAAQLLMLFLGLAAEEVCALNVGDLLPIPHYSVDQLRVAKQYKKIGNEFTLTSELPKQEAYRNIPVPLLFKPLIPPCKDRATDAPLLPDPTTNRRINPEHLKKKFRTLFAHSAKATIGFLREDGSTGTLQISFRPENYRQSCRHFWQFVCGLQTNEVRYLSGLTQTDTASRHYIDFNNAHKQYRMCTQMGYGLMAVMAPGDLPSFSVQQPVPRRKLRLPGMAGHTLHTRVLIRQAGELRIHAAHGASVRVEGGVPHGAP